MATWWCYTWHVTVKHMTASALVWSDHGDGALRCAGGGGAVDGDWRLGLVEHPLRRLLLPPGGHVEPDENTAQAVLRELAEETGLEVDLMQPPGPVVPSAFPVHTVDRPWWICEHPIPYDNKLAQPHVHVDHVYVAVARSPVSLTPPAHPFGWYPSTAWPDLTMAEDTRQLAAAILPTLTDFTPRF